MVHNTSTLRPKDDFSGMANRIAENTKLLKLIEKQEKCNHWFEEQVTKSPLIHKVCSCGAEKFE